MMDEVFILKIKIPFLVPFYVVGQKLKLLPEAPR